jgi:hypothetical protein
MTTRDKIRELEEEVARREVLFNAARERMYLARADLDEAKGDTFSAGWHRALAAGDNEAARRFYIESQARNVLARGAPFGEPTERDRAEIAAEVERQRSAGSEGTQAQG